MISLAPTVAETTAAKTLLDIIANPELARKHLEALIAEKKAAVDAHDMARQAQADAKKEHDAALAKIAEAHAETEKEHEAAAKKLAEASRLSAEHEVRTKALDDRHETLLAKDNRLKVYEAQLTAHEKQANDVLSRREREVEQRESAVEKREHALHALETQAQNLTNEYERKLAALKDAMK